MLIRRRSGHLLVEALCALALSGVLAAAAAASLTGVRRAIAAADARSESSRAGREALWIIGALARDADGLRIEGDTALALSVRSAASAVCAVDSLSLTLPPAATSAARPITLRSQAIETGDEVAVLVADTSSGRFLWWRSEVDSVRTRTAAEPCGAALGWLAPVDAGRPRLELFVTPRPSSAVMVGAAVRVARPGRLAPYVSSGGEWMLGWRRCLGRPPRCGVVQPVAGPLRTPASGGLRLRISPPEGGLLIEVRVPGEALPVRGVVALRDPP